MKFITLSESVVNVLHVTLHYAHLFLVDDEDENGLIETGDILRDAPVAAKQDVAVQHKILEVAFAMDESIKQQLGDDANEIFLLMGHIVSF